MWPCNLAWGCAVTLITHAVDITPKKQGMGCVQRGCLENNTKQQAHQAGFTDDADEDAAGKHGQVLQQEPGGHDQACGADEQGHKEVPDAGQLAEAVLLLVCGGQHDPSHKSTQLR